MKKLDNTSKIFAIILIFMTLLMIIILTIPSEKEETNITNKEIMSVETLSYNEFMENIQNKNINIVYMYSLNDEFYFCEYNDELYKIVNPQYDTFKKELLENGVNIENTQDLLKANTKSNPKYVFGIIAIFVFVWIIYAVVTTESKNNKKTSLKSMQSGKIKSELYNEQSQTTQKTATLKTFEDIAGLKEVKKDMRCVVDFLKNEKKYKDMGANLPKGIILYGPPGTGKTLLAKAIAGEAKVPFFYMSGSDFIEKYVGVGAQRVRELFNEAKKCAPCIIFIDEIDAIGGHRDNDDATSEDRKTINALLAEMDGFGTNKETQNVLVIGATNRIEDLDKALIRPGRFTEKYCVPLPYSIEERLEVINIYKVNKKFDESVDFEQLAKDTIGSSPADIEALLNEAAIIAVQDDKKAIDNISIEKATIKQMLNGHIKEDEKKKDEELKLVAWHEAGHALVGKLLGLDVSKVTIKSTTTGAGGVTFTIPRKVGLYSLDDLKIQVKQLYAGRCAEYLFYNDWNKITTGASNDIEQATKILYNIISTYGMTDTYDMLNLEILHVSNDKILNDCQTLAQSLKQDTMNILTNNKDKLQRIVNQLLEKETIYGEDLDLIIVDCQEDDSVSNQMVTA